MCLGAGSDFAAIRPDHCRCPGRAISLVPLPGATAVVAFVTFIAFIATSPWPDTHQIGRRRQRTRFSRSQDYSSRSDLPIAAGRTGGLARARSIAEAALRAYAADFLMHAEMVGADDPISDADSGCEP